MFYLTKIESGRINTPEPLSIATTPGTAYKSGDALKIASGALVQCAATDKPTYVALENYTAPATGNRALTVARVSPDMLFEAPTSAAPAAVGAKVKLAVNAGHADGVSADTTSGVATIVSTNGATAAGDKVIVRFD